jgi:serine/threonine protein kinase
MTVRDVVRCGLDFLMGLHHAHVRDIVHFDVKPSNVLFDASGAAGLADFGLSRVVGELGLADQGSYYRPHMVPEREFTNTLTKAADVYQSALTLYRMCIGNYEWKAQIAKLGGRNSDKFGDAVVKGTFPDRQAFPIHVPNALKTLIRNALDVNPDTRTPTALDLSIALAAVDRNLDWQWRRIGATHEEWRLPREQSTLLLTLRDPGNGKWWAEAHREGVNPVRFNKRCAEGVSLTVAKKHLMTIMGEEEPE